MSVQRSVLARGPGYLTVGSATVPSTTTNIINFADDARITFDQVTDVLLSALQGRIDETRRDFAVRLTGTPIAYTPGQAALMSFLFPQLNGLPAIGASLCGNSDTAGLFLASNGDAVSIYNMCVPKPPELTLSVEKHMLGPLTIVGLVRNGYDPETASSYYKLQSGQPYAEPVLLQPADYIGRQRYYATWAAGDNACNNSNWTNFQGQDGITLSFEAEWQPVTVQGRTVDYTLVSMRAMAKLIPVGPTPSDIDTCAQYQGAGAYHGSRLSANTAMGSLVISGQQGGAFTILNAVLKTSGFVFGGKPLRLGEIGFLGTFNMTATPATGGTTLA